MPDYRRWYIPGGTFFFTVVTCERRPILATELARKLLHDAIAFERQKRPFAVVAMVLLPDHLHTIWQLPRGDCDYSIRWRKIKESFTKDFIVSGGDLAAQNRSRRRRREQTIWQRRFWEHTVRDEEDLQRCVDYVHWNPRKHQLVQRVRDWRWSTFHRFVEAGHYDIDWGGTDPCPGYDIPEWGE